MPIVSQNPATGEILKQYSEIDAAQLEVKLSLAEKAFQQWRGVAFPDRARLMVRLSDHLKNNARSYGAIITAEIGRPIRAAVAEIEKCAWVCEYYAEQGPLMMGEDVVPTDARESYVRFEPLGVVLAVMPWNFPFWQVMRFAAPAVMAGNVALLKHASNVPQAAEILEKMFPESGFPAGVFQNMFLSSGKVEAVIRDPRVRAVTLTGSEQAGSQVASTAGQEIKKSVLELGGSDPFIVFADADLERSCEVGVMARLQNCGQSCIAAKRFIVVESVARQFLERYKVRYESLVVGDPTQEDTDVGPLATEKIRDEVARQVDESVSRGARLVTGGQKLPRPGFFYAPTILADVKPGMPVYDQEVFGPVAAVITVKDEDEAVRVANDTPFGLGASLWTQDPARMKRVIPRLEVGAVFVNSMVKSDPRLPFGGSKKSGYGRELSGYGLKEFVNIKTVWVQ